MKDDGNPMHQAQSAQRCTARTKRTGLPCQAPAVGGWTVCRMHGAGGGAPFGPGNGMWRHGGRSTETTRIRRLTAALSRLSRDTCADL